MTEQDTCMCVYVTKGLSNELELIKYIHENLRIIFAGFNYLHFFYNSCMKLLYQSKYYSDFREFR